MRGCGSRGVPDAHLAPPRPSVRKLVGWTRPPASPVGGTGAGDWVLALQRQCPLGAARVLGSSHDRHTAVQPSALRLCKRHAWRSASRGDREGRLLAPGRGRGQGGARFSVTRPRGASGPLGWGWAWTLRPGTRPDGEVAGRDMLPTRRDGGTVSGGMLQATLSLKRPGSLSNVATVGTRGSRELRPEGLVSCRAQTEGGHRPWEDGSPPAARSAGTQVLAEDSLPSC